ncbi:hypothetical protein pb186bvf_006263 [Paramecium bursaria]
MSFKLLVKKERDVSQLELEIQANQNITWVEIIEYLLDNNSQIVQTIPNKNQKYAFYINNNKKLITDLHQQVLPVDEHPLSAILIYEEQIYRYRDNSSVSKISPLPINMPLQQTQSNLLDDFHTDQTKLDEVLVRMKLSDDNNIQLQQTFSVNDKIGRINDYLIEAFGKDKHQVHFDLLVHDSVIGPAKYDHQIGQVFKFEKQNAGMSLELRIKIKYTGGNN